jgi:hypothetical protein
MAKRSLKQHIQELDALQVRIPAQKEEDRQWTEELTLQWNALVSWMKNRCAEVNTTTKINYYTFKEDGENKFEVVFTVPGQTSVMSVVAFDLDDPDAIQYTQSFKSPLAIEYESGFQSSARWQKPCFMLKSKRFSVEEIGTSLFKSLEGSWPSRAKQAPKTALQTRSKANSR